MTTSDLKKLLENSEKVEKRMEKLIGKILHSIRPQHHTHPLPLKSSDVLILKSTDYLFNGQTMYPRNSDVVNVLVIVPLICVHADGRCSVEVLEVLGLVRLQVASTRVAHSSFGVTADRIHSTKV